MPSKLRNGHLYFTLSGLALIPLLVVGTQAQSPPDTGTSGSVSSAAALPEESLEPVLPEIEPWNGGAPEGPGCGAIIYQQGPPTGGITTQGGVHPVFLHDDCALAGTERNLCTIEIFASSTVAPYNAFLTIYSACPVIGNNVPCTTPGSGGCCGDSGATLIYTSPPVAVTLTGTQLVTFPIPNIVVTTNTIFVGIAFDNAAAGGVFAADPQEIGSSATTYTRCNNQAAANNGCTRAASTGTFAMTIYANPDTTPGRCCDLQAGTCNINVPANQCTAPYQQFTPNNTNCGEVNCTAHTGACCTDGNCQTTTFANCVSPGVWMGIDTVCTPNCCPAPNDNRGADNCENVVVTAVPVNGTTVVVRGDNTPAGLITPDTGAACLAANDTGWWEAFSISEPANVLIEWCCTTPIHSPVYTAIFSGCPCIGAIVNNDFNLAFGGTLPNCTASDISPRLSYNALPAGTYYHRVLHRPGQVPPDRPKGPYTVHYTATPLSFGACCLGSGCQVATPLSCSQQGGVFMGDGTNCDPGGGGLTICQSSMGSCCNNQTGACTVTTGANCTGNTVFTALADCSPNCCAQAPSGAETCENVTVKNVITGGPVVDYSGDTTFAGSPAQCADLGDHVFFEAFTITETSKVTISLECSPGIYSPVWNHLQQNCGQPTFCTVDTASNAFASNFGGTLPPLPDSNFYAVWNSLPAGTWYYPIFSDPTPPPDPRGPYNLHIRAEPIVSVTLCYGGDLNDDGDFNGRDIPGFVQVLLGSDTNPDHICAANVDGSEDGSGNDTLNQADVALFSQALVRSQEFSALDPPASQALVCFNAKNRQCDTTRWVIAKTGANGKDVIVNGSRDGVLSDCNVKVQRRAVGGANVGAECDIPPGGSKRVTMAANQELVVWCAPGAGVCRISYNAKPKPPQAGEQTCP